MKRENEISEELINMGSKLAFLPHSMPFVISENYFDQFSKAIHTSIVALDEPELDRGWSRSMPYYVPDAYFSNLGSQIVTRVADVDFAMGSGNKTSFEVPEGYFQSFPEKVLAQAKKNGTDPEAKTKKPQYSLFALSKSWAAAAVILITIGIGANEFFNSQPPTHVRILATIPANDIKDYFQNAYSLNAERIVGAKELNGLQLEIKDIIEYLDESGWN